MNVLSKIASFFTPSKNEFDSSAASVKPVTGGSVPTNPMHMPGMAIEPEVWRRGQLKVLRYLAVNNSSIAYAVQNTIVSANTTFNIEFSDKVSSAKAAEMREFIQWGAKSWVSGGMPVLCRTLFRNAILEGCVSVEPQIEGKKVTAVRFADPLHLYFYPDGNGGSVPFFDNGRQKVQAGPNYHYAPLAWDGYTDYPVPGLITAIENAELQAEAKSSFRTMLRNLGMLGSLAINLKAPSIRTGESAAAYEQRLTGIIQSQHEQFKKGLANGLTVGFNEMTSYNVIGANINSGNATAIAAIVNQWMATSLKTNSDMIGDNQSSTKSFGEVLLNQMVMTAGEFQTTVAGALEHIILYHLLAGGFNPGYVRVTFERPNVFDKKAEEETYATKLANLTTLYMQGIISQEQFAQEAGYDKANLPEPAGSKPAESDKTSAAVIKKLVASAGRPLPAIYADSTVFDGKISDFRDAPTQKISAAYLAKLEKGFDSALKKTIEEVRKAVLKSKPGSEQAFLALFMKTFSATWVTQFDRITLAVVPAAVDSAYSFFRKDKRVFKESYEKFNGDKDIPESVFDLLDYRLIEYFQNADKLYLGKILTDPKSVSRFVKMLQEEYINSAGDIGRDSKLLDEFLKEFEADVQGDKYKLRRIIETTVVNLRNYANVKYIEQAGLTRFRRVEVMDPFTCSHCISVNGEIFEVAREIDRATAFVENSPEVNEENSPFAVTIPIENFKKMSSSELQDAGVGASALHPHCRGRIVIDRDEY